MAECIAGCIVQDGLLDESPVYKGEVCLVQLFTEIHGSG